MKDQNAAQLLARVMGWQEISSMHSLKRLQLLAEYKYNSYQRFGPGRRFIENLALWLEQFDTTDREAALKLVVTRLVFFSESELSHLVSTAYPDLIVQERIRLVAEELDIPNHKVLKICSKARFKELQAKSLYLGLSDGARTNEVRRSSMGDISNEQIWQAYELSDDKARDMLDSLKITLDGLGKSEVDARFNLIWLLDDFSGSGNTYIRYDNISGKYKGKLKKIFERLYKGDLIDPHHYEVFLLLYTATRQAIDHIEYWSERFTSENGYKSVQVKVLFPIEAEYSLANDSDSDIAGLLAIEKYYDSRASDKHIEVGGTLDARLGFAACALPIVLSHNSPNNSIYIFWGPENYSPFGLFPRVSRHREF